MLVVASRRVTPVGCGTSSKSQRSSSSRASLAVWGSSSSSAAISPVVVRPSQARHTDAAVPLSSEQRRCPGRRREPRRRPARRQAARSARAECASRRRSFYPTTPIRPPVDLASDPRSRPDLWFCVNAQQRGPTTAVRNRNTGKWRTLRVQRIMPFTGPMRPRSNRRRLCPTAAPATSTDVSINELKRLGEDTGSTLSRHAYSRSSTSTPSRR